MKKIIIILLTLVVLSGCISYSYYSFYKLNEEVKVESDKFEPSIKFMGIEKAIFDEYGIQNGYHFLRSHVDKTTGQIIFHQLYVTYSYKFDWRFYNSAYGLNSVVLEFREIDQDVECSSYGCEYTEDFAIIIPDEYLRANTNGFEIKVKSKAGYALLLSIEAEQIQEQLKAIDSN